MSDGAPKITEEMMDRASAARKRLDTQIQEAAEQLSVIATADIADLIEVLSVVRTVEEQRAYYMVRGVSPAFRAKRDG